MTPRATVHRCWFHIGQWQPCPICIRAHAAQRAEDRRLAGRAVSQTRRESCRETGRAHGVGFGPQRKAVA